MTEAAQWGYGRPQFRHGEEAKRIRAWYRRVACPKCNVANGRACRTASGHPTGNHRARSDATGPPPYEEWRKEGLLAPGQATVPAILVDSHTMRNEYNVGQSLGDAVAIVSHVLANRLGIDLGDDPTLDRLDDAARSLALARGPEGSADLVTVLATRVAALVGIIAGPDGDPEAMFTGLIRDRVDLARQQRDTRRRISE